MILHMLFLILIKASGQRVGIGVVGIIECDFLKPAHNKQDFEYTKEYRYSTQKKKEKCFQCEFTCVFAFIKLG